MNWQEFSYLMHWWGDRLPSYRRIFTPEIICSHHVCFHWKIWLQYTRLSLLWNLVILAHRWSNSLTNYWRISNPGQCSHWLYFLETCTTSVRLIIETLTLWRWFIWSAKCTQLVLGLVLMTLYSNNFVPYKIISALVIGHLGHRSF